MPSQLPPSKWPEGGQIDGIYSQLLEMEKTILDELKKPTIMAKPKEKETQLIQVRVVGHLMHVAPAPWCDRLAEALSITDSGIRILQVADLYINHLFRLRMQTVQCVHIDRLTIHVHS